MSNQFYTNFKRRFANGSLVATFIATQFIATFVLFMPAVANAADTGFKTPTSTHSPNDWDVSTVSYVQANDSDSASDNDGDSQGYSGFNFGVPANATINGIEVHTIARSSDPSGCKLRVNLLNIDNYKYADLTNSDSSLTLGGAVELWGGNWNASDFSDSSFYIRVQDNDPGNNCDNNATTYLNLLEVKVYYTERPAVANNPTLLESCGLDIALVMDNSNSIDDTEMSNMKTAMKGFTNALNGTPTYFSLTKFGTNATVTQSFTNNVTSVNSAIDAVSTGGGGTNWEDGLLKANSTFDPRTSKPNLVIFASDGNPTYHIGGGSGSSTSDTDINRAITQANVIKNGGARILALGIGSDLSLDNLKLISGNLVNQPTLLNSDVISTDFSTMATKLAEFAKQTCGGTVTVHKQVKDANGNISNGSGWTFNVGGQANKLTGVDGKTDAVKLNPGTGYSITETAQNGYTLESASCTGATNNGSQSLPSGGVNGITIGNTDIVSCTFVNKRTSGTIELKKSWPNEKGQTTLNIGTTANGSDIASQQTGTNGTAPLTTGKKTVGTGTYYLSESNTTSGFTGALSCTDESGSLNIGTSNSVVVAANKNVVCTYTNTRDKGSVKVNKLVDSDGNGSFETANPNNFNWSLNGSGTNAMGSTKSDVPTGNHSVNENSVSDYHFVGWYATNDTSHSCSNPTGTTLPVSIVVNKGQTSEITLCNARNMGTLQVFKNVDLNGDGDYTDANETGATDWQWSANNGSWRNTGSAAVSVATGNYALEEQGPNGFSFVSLTCQNGTLNTQTNTVAVTTGKNVVCTFYNKRDTATISFLKEVIGGSSQPSDWTFTISGNNGTAKSGDTKTYQTGTYTVTESGPTGYTATGASGACSMNELGVISLLVTLQGGQCKVTNTRDTGSLTVNKALDDNGDGTFETPNPTNFNWSVAGHSNMAMGSSINSLETGPYSVTENGPANGYSFVGWYATSDDQHSCTNPSGTTLPVNVAVVKGQSSNITLCNKRDTGTITVNKSLLPANDSGKFNLVINGTAKAIDVGNNGTTGQLSVSTGSYEISETAGTNTDLSNYISIYSCTDGQQVIATGSGTTIPKLQLNKGVNIVCTFTNTKKATVIIKKVTSPVNDPTDFNFTTNLGDGFRLKGGQSKTFQTAPGNYTVTEQANSNWEQTSATCDNKQSPAQLSVSAGQIVTCTFTNTLKTGSIGVTKSETDANGNNAKPLRYWKFFLDANNNGVWNNREKQGSTNSSGQLNFTGLVAGEYRVCEQLQSGWMTVVPANSNCMTVTVTPNETINVLFKNFHKGSITGYKFHDLNGNGTREFGEPKIGGWTIYLYKDGSATPTNTTQTSSNIWTVGNYQFDNLTPGEYTVCEANPIGWQQVTPDPSVQNGCHKFTISRSGQDETAIFGNRAVATITVVKNVDNGRSGGLQEDVDNWTWNYSGVAASQSGISTGSANPVTVPTGLFGHTYVINENQQEGYDLTNVDCGDEKFIQLGDYISVFATKGENIVCTLTNSKRASLTVTKDAQPDSDTKFDFRLTWGKHEHTMSNFQLQDTGDEDGNNSKTFSLKAGTYSVFEENLPEGWNLSDISCGETETEVWGNQVTLDVKTGDEINCTFTNKQDNTVVVHKYEDLNRNGQYDEGEQMLPDWDFTLARGNDCEVVDVFVRQLFSEVEPPSDNCSPESASQTKATGEDGTATFTGVKPDSSYKLSEEIPSDSKWNLGSVDCGEGLGSLDGDTFYFDSESMGAGNTINCWVGNYRTPVLNITKTNNRPNPTRTGDTVTYTLTVSVPEDSGMVFGTKVTDLPPQGFVYVPGTWTSSSNMSLASVSEPAYGSPGSWFLGNLLPGQVVTLTYQAKIASSVSNGTYPDMAFAAGCNQSGSEGDCDYSVVFANVSTGSPTPFVGTNVIVTSDAPKPSTVVRYKDNYANTGSAFAWMNALAAMTLAGAALVTIVYRPQKGGKK